MTPQLSLERVLSCFRSRSQERNTHSRHSTPGQAKVRDNSAQPLKKSFSPSKMRSITEYFKPHNLCAPKTKTMREGSSAETHVDLVSIGFNGGESHPQEVSPSGHPKKRVTSSMSQNSESESPEFASRDTNIPPSVELNRHPDIRNINTNMAHHDSIHDTHPAKSQEILLSAPNPQNLESHTAHHNSVHDTYSAENQGDMSSTSTPQETLQLLHTNQNIDRFKVLASPTTDLSKEPSHTTIYHDDSNLFYNLPVPSLPFFIGSEEAMGRGCKECQIMSKEIAKVRDDKRELQKKSQRDEEESTRAVVALQEMSFKALRTRGWLLPTSDSIKLELFRIKGKLKEWTKVAIKDDSRLGYISAVFQTDKQAIDAFGEELKKVMVFRKAIPLEGLPERKAGRILLEALLAHHLFSTMFSLPFSFLGEEASRLNALYEAGQSWSPKDAHKWRSDTIRLGFPEASKDGKAEVVRLQTQELIDRRADIEAEDFINSPANYLFHTDVKLLIELQKLYKEAAILSHRLWGRRAMLKILTLDELNPSFDINDRMMTLHGMVKEDVENQLTGQPITLVVSPAIISYGTEDGEDYESPRIWTPAEVWLYDPLLKRPE